MDCFFGENLHRNLGFTQKNGGKKVCFLQSFTTNSRNTSILMIKTPPKSKMIKHMWTSPFKPLFFWGGSF